MTDYFIKRGESVSGPYSPLEVKNGVASGKILAGDGIGQSKNGPWHEAKSVGGLEFQNVQNMEGLSDDQIMHLLGEYEYMPEEFPQADEVKQIEKSPARSETPPEDAPGMPAATGIILVLTAIVVVGLIFGVRSLVSKANAYQEAVENYETALRDRVVLMNLSLAALKIGRFDIARRQLKGLEAMKVQGDASDKSKEFLRQANRGIEQAYQEFDAACRKAGKENPYLPERPLPLPQMK